MKAVIAGGTGLIGRHLAASLVGSGAEVIVLSRHPEGATGLPTRVRLAGWDGRTPGAWMEAASGATAVINLAGASLAEGRWTAERKRLIVASRTEPGAALVAAVDAAESKPRVFVQSSAVGYYGDRGDDTVTEETPRGRGFLPEVCQEWEASTEPIDRMGIRRVVIRTGVVLSAQAGAVGRMLGPFKVGLGGPIGGGDQWMPWIHLEDVVAAIRHLVETDAAPGPYNLTAPTPVTNADFSRALGAAVNRPALMPIPAFAMRALFGEMAVVLLEGQRAVPERLLSTGFEFKHIDVAAALKDLLA